MTATSSPPRQKIGDVEQEALVYQAQLRWGDEPFEKDAGTPTVLILNSEP